MADKGLLHERRAGSKVDAIMFARTQLAGPSPHGAAARHVIDATKRFAHHQRVVIGQAGDARSTDVSAYGAEMWLRR